MAFEDKCGFSVLTTFVFDRNISGIMFLLMNNVYTVKKNTASTQVDYITVIVHFVYRRTRETLHCSRHGT